MALKQKTSDNLNYRTLSGFTGASVIDMQNTGSTDARAQEAERGAVARYRYGKGTGYK